MMIKIYAKSDSSESHNYIREEIQKVSDDFSRLPAETQALLMNAALVKGSAFLKRCFQSASAACTEKETSIQPDRSSLTLRLVQRVI